jgi:hypothetical protein
MGGVIAVRNIAGVYEKKARKQYKTQKDAHKREPNRISRTIYLSL